MNLLTNFDNPPVSARRWVVAYSGGLDSTVTLYLACQQFGAENVVALHINHHISSNALQWEEHCLNVATSLKTSFHSSSITLNSSSGLGLEASAREERYQCFKRFCQEGDALLMGHHLDDQVETLFFRLIRGSGLDGLTAMPKTRLLKTSVWLWRPLLEVPREQLLQFANQKSLSWIDDESNEDTSLDRNYLRHAILPLIERRWPHYKQSCLKSLNVLKASQEWEQQKVEQCAETSFKGNFKVFPLDLLSSKSPYEKSLLLRFWLKKNSISLPSQKVLQEILSMGDVKEDKLPQVHLNEWVVGRYRQALHLYKSLPCVNHDFTVGWELDRSLQLPDHTWLTASRISSEELSRLQSNKNVVRIKSNDLVQIRYRRGGERCQPADRAHSQTLKKLLQEYDIPPWLRDRLPLIYINQQIAVVGNIFICKEFSAASSNVDANRSGDHQFFRFSWIQ